MEGCGIVTSWLAEAGALDRNATWEEPGRDVRDWRIRRPSLPPMLFVALAFWLGIAFASDVLFGSDASACLGFCAYSAGAAAVLAVILLVWRHLAACVAVGIALGCLIGGAHAHGLVAAQQELLENPGPAHVQAVHDARPSMHGASVVARTASGAIVRIYLESGTDVLVGDVVEVDGSWRAPSPKSARKSWRDGIVACARATGSTSPAEASALAPLRMLRRHAIRTVAARSDRAKALTGLDLGDAAMVLAAVDLGHAGELYGSELYQTAKVDGLAHLFAVSGAHLAIVCGIVGAGFRRMPFGRAAAIAMQVAFILAYLVLTGAPTSAVRAAVMATLALIAYVPGRRPYALGALSCGIAAMLALDPATAFSTSFLLSVASTLGIVLFAGWFSELFKAAFHLPQGAIQESLAVTFAATIATGPVSACAFGQVSLVAPIANLVAAPAFPVICLGGLVAIMVSAAAPAGAALLVPLLVAVSAFCRVLTALAGIPFASCPASLPPIAAGVLALGVPAVIWFIWPYPRMRVAGGAMLVCLAAAMIGAISPALRGDAVTMLDVGQGDAILVQSAGRSLLIDTGTEDAALLEGLASCGAYALDAVLITHPDDDHCGSLAALRGIVPVGEVLVARDLLQEDNAHCAGLRAAASALVGEGHVRGLAAGDVIHVGGIGFTVVGPDAFADGGGNADSLVLRMDYDADADGVPDTVGLFCGDAESEQVNRYIAQGRIGDVDLYKVGHHGSKAAVDDPMLAALAPEVSIVSVGAYNTYGHPAPRTLERLHAAGSAVFRTDEQGAITCLLDANGIRVHCAR